MEKVVKNKRYNELTQILDEYVAGVSEMGLMDINKENHGHFDAGEMTLDHFNEIFGRIAEIKNKKDREKSITAAIKNDIEAAINENTDKTLSLINIVSLTLDKYSTLEIAEFYKDSYENDLRYFLEQRIERMFSSSES